MLLVLLNVSKSMQEVINFNIGECSPLFKPNDIKRDLNTVEKWTSSNLMKFNERKRQVLL